MQGQTVTLWGVSAPHLPEESPAYPNWTLHTGVGNCGIGLLEYWLIGAYFLQDPVLKSLPKTEYTEHNKWFSGTPVFRFIGNLDVST